MTLPLTCRRGDPNSSPCAMPPVCHGRAWARGSSGELLFHASVWRCKEKPVSPRGEGREGRDAFRSRKSITFNPHPHRDVCISAAQGQQEYFCNFSSHLEKKKKGISYQELPGTRNRAAAPSPLPQITPSKAEPPPRPPCSRDGGWDGKKNHRSMKLPGVMEISASEGQGLLVWVGKTPSSQRRARAKGTTSLL